MSDAVRAADDSGAMSEERRPGFAGGLLLLLVLGYALFLWRFYAPAISTPDANGYFAQGSLIAQTGRAWFVPESPTQYVGLHWLLGDEGRFFSRYAPGMGVAVAAIGRVLPIEYGTLVNPLCALAALIGLYGLARVYLPAGWSVLAPALLGLNALFARYAIAGDAHMPPAALLVLGLWALARWSRDGGAWRIALAGLLLGAIPTVRYPEAIFGPGVAVFVLLHARTRRPILLHALAGAAGAAIPLGLLAARNQAAFGAFWRTAYALTNEQTGFSWDYFRAHFTQYLRFVQSDGAGLLFAFGLAGMALLPARRETRPLGLAAALMAIPSMLLYMAYYWAPAQMATGTMRFLVPTIPLYVLAGVFALRALASAAGSRAAGAALVAVVVVFQALWSVPPALDDLRRMHASNRALAEAVRAIDREVPRGAVVMAPPGLLQHLDFVRRWKLVDMGLARGAGPGERMMEGRDDGRPRPQQAGKRQAQTAKYEGLGAADRERAFADDVAAWAAGQPVFYVGTEPEIKGLRGALFHPENFRIVARAPMPEIPPEPERDLGFGGGRGAGRSARDANDPRGAALYDIRRRFARGVGGLMRGDFLGGEKEMVIAVWTPVPRRPIAPAMEDRLDRFLDGFQPGPMGPRRR
jgi:hypothetical protein